MYGFHKLMACRKSQTESPIKPTAESAPAGRFQPAAEVEGWLMQFRARCYWRCQLVPFRVDHSICPAGRAHKSRNTTAAGVARQWRDVVCSTEIIKDSRGHDFSVRLPDLPAQVFTLKPPLQGIECSTFHQLRAALPAPCASSREPSWFLIVASPTTPGSPRSKVISPALSTTAVPRFANT
jgi:hypothetical protein